jgi:O-antigen/teichoic acid export membrane protein
MRGLRRWQGGGRWRGLAALSSGAAVSQLVALAATPLLTRMYGPEAFGVLAVITASIIVCATVAAGRYELSISIVKSATEARVGFWLCTVLTAVFAGTLAISMPWLGPAAAEWFSSPDLYPLSWLLVPGLLIAGVFQTLTAAGLRSRTYGAIARARLSQGLTTAAAQVGCGFMGWGVIALVSSAVLGQAAGTTRLIKQARPIIWPPVVGLRTLAAYAWQHRRYPAFSASSGLASVLSLYLPAFALGVLYSPAAAGQYAVAQRLLYAPVTLLARTASSVYLAESAHLLREDEQHRLRADFVGTLRVGAAVGLLLGAGAAIASPLIFPILLGPAWSESGRMGTALAVLLFSQMVALPLQQTLNVLSRLGVQAAFDVLRLAAAAGSLTTAHYLGFSPVAAVASYGGSLAVVHLLNVFAAYRALSNIDSGGRT